MCAVRIALRRDTLENWAEQNPILGSGEVGWVLNSARSFKIGNGVDRWNDLQFIKFGDDVFDGKLIIQKNGTDIGTFSANQSDDTVVNIEADTPTFSNLQGSPSDNEALSQELSGKLPTSHNTDENAHEDIRKIAEDAESIAKGKSLAQVFDTFEDMETYLIDPENKGKLLVGDNLYIKELNTPDYWVSGVLEEPDPISGYYYKINQLSSEVPDITNMATTDTAQTISGDKNFTGSLQKNGVSVATTTDVNNHHDSTKQDTIDDLESIRAGAELGATALQSVSSTDITNALGYTPYSNANPSGYQTNVLEGVQLNGTDLTIDVNKKVNIPYAGGTAGVLKLNNANYGHATSSGTLIFQTRAYEGSGNTYKSLNEYGAIGKGTLENVLDNETLRIDKQQILTETQKTNVLSSLPSVDMEIEFSDGSESTLSLVGKM